jgi:hypothetical protein
MKDIEPFRDCPRFDFCSVNHCPLDPEQAKRLPDPGDKEKKCTLAKTIRMRIGSRFPELLPLGGLTPREYNGHQQWENAPTERREALRTRVEGFNRQKSGLNAKTPQQSATEDSNE